MSCEWIHCTVWCTSSQGKEGNLSSIRMSVPPCHLLKYQKSIGIQSALQQPVLFLARLRSSRPEVHGSYNLPPGIPNCRHGLASASATATALLSRISEASCLGYGCAVQLQCSQKSYSDRSTEPVATWIYMDLYGSIWIYMVYLWIYMDLYGLSGGRTSLVGSSHNSTPRITLGHNCELVQLLQLCCFIPLHGMDL